MTEKQDVSKVGISADWLLRGTLTRLGDKLDIFTGRKAAAPSSLATSQLIERLKLLIDSEAKDVAGKGKVVPHNIKLKIQWDKFSEGEGDTLTRLQNELLAAAADHINDSLFYTFAPLDLQVTPDYFTDGVKLWASFEEFSEVSNEMNVTPLDTVMPLSKEIVETESTTNQIFLNVSLNLDGTKKAVRIAVPPDGRISIGRTGGNELIIDDASVSKTHAALSIDPEGKISVADTGSTNGTFINDQRMAYGKASKLVPLDIVKFGSVEVSFEVEREVVEGNESVQGDISKDETVTIGEFEFTTRSESSEDSKNGPGIS